MINEERVKELYEIAIYDNGKKKKSGQMGMYYRSDYISKEMIKSIFTGTLAFFLCAALWIFYDMENILVAINSLDVIAVAVSTVCKYVIFMVVYEIITYIIYYRRYTRGRKELKEYCSHLKRVNKLYEREDKIKNSK